MLTILAHDTVALREELLENDANTRRESNKVRGLC